MSPLTKSLSVLIQLLLVLCFMASNGEAANNTLRLPAGNGNNRDTYVKVDDSTSSLTGLNSFSVDLVERGWQQWFWYRIGQAGGETSLDILPKKVATTQPTPASLLITYTLAGQFDISVLYELTVYPSGAGKASLKKTVTITNTTGSVLDYHLFEYSDYDLSDSGGSVGDNDNIEIYNNKVYQNGTQSDSSGVTFVHESSLPPNKIDIDDGSGTVKAALNDTEPSDFAGLVTPYSYGSDKQFVKQWDLAIPAGQSVSFTITDSFYPTLPVTASVTNPASCVNYGGQVGYTINFDNTVNSEDLTNFKVIDYLPSNTIPTVNPPVDGSVYDSMSNTVTWSLSMLNAGAVQQTRQLSTTVNSSTDLFNNILLVSDQAFPTRIPIADPGLDPVPTSLLCNHPPSINKIQDAIISEGTSFSTQVVANDPDSNSLVYSLSGAPTGMTISTVGLIDYPAAAAGTYVIKVTVTDNGPGALSDSKPFTLKIVKINKAPVFTSSPTTAANSNQLYTYFITATDPDDDTLSFGLSKAQSGMSVSGSLISWTPTTTQIGDHVIQAMVYDGYGHYVYQDFTITVKNAPHPPTINVSTLPSASATVGQGYSYQLLASDPGGDTLLYSLTNKPAGMTISTTGLIEWIPTAGQNNQVHVITVQVNDGSDGIATYNFSVTVGTVSSTDGAGSNNDGAGNDTGSSLPVDYTLHSGDVNRDGKINISDALLVFRMSLGLQSPTAENSTHADVGPMKNKKPAPDGKIDIDDVIVMLLRLTGEIPAW